MLSVLAGASVDGRRCRRRIVPALIAAFVAVMGLAMLVGAAFFGLAERMPASLAAAVTGGGLLAMAGLIGLIAWLLDRARPAVAASSPPASGFADLLSAAATAIGRDAHEQAPQFAVIALLAGCAVGASPRLRRVLADAALSLGNRP